MSISTLMIEGEECLNVSWLIEREKKWRSKKGMLCLAGMGKLDVMVCGRLASEIESQGCLKKDQQYLL